MVFGYIQKNVLWAFVLINYVVFVFRVKIMMKDPRYDICKTHFNISWRFFRLHFSSRLPIQGDIEYLPFPYIKCRIIMLIKHHFP